MFYVSIKKQNIETNAASFETLDLANAWIAQCESDKAWGEPAYTEIIPEVLEIKDELGEVIQTAVPAHDIVHPSEYTIEVTDITTQVAYEKDIAKRVARINFGTQLFAELATRNVLRLKAGTTTLADLMSAEAKLAVVQRLMANSSTEIALQTLQAAIIPEIPQIEKDFFIAKIAAYLAAE